jgi:signal transduction histidine kinase
MGFRLRSIRRRIFLLVLVPVLSLVGLYLFATSIAAQDALNLSHANAIKNATGEPTGNLLGALDAERPLAMVYMSGPTGANLAVLEGQESKTNGAAAALRAALTSGATQGTASAQEKQSITVLLKSVSGLASLRSQIAAQIITRQRALGEYDAIAANAYQVLNSAIRQETDATLITQSLAFVRMGKSEEFLLQEDALLLGDMTARSFPAGDRHQFTELAGARSELYNQTLGDLDPLYRAYYQKNVTPQALAALTALENTVSSDTAGGPPRVQPAAWNAAVGNVSSGLSAAGTQAAAGIVVRAQNLARSSFLRLILAGGLGLLAVILSILVSIWIGRGLVRELAALRESALELANNRLPSVVRRLAEGKDVDVPAEAPDISASSDEIGQVRLAFASVQQTAVEAAVGQARLRQGISDIFRNLARRSQSLLHRQLTLLDAMERRANEPDQLADLFRIDHLTTRMRRHAESLIILSGDAPARGWRNPVPLVDVLRAAVAEVEDYTRIKVSATTRAALAGPAVGDVIHLIAELAENAAIFSPPNTPVLISGDIVGRGFAVEIEDRGLGLSEEQLAEINDRLENPPAFDLSGSDQLGLFVASQLAKRHDIRISLRASPYGGTTAIVLIPVSLVVPEGTYENDPSAASADERAIQLTGRHAAREEDGGPGASPPVTSLFAQTAADSAGNGRAASSPVPGYPENGGPLGYAQGNGSLAYPQEPEPLTYAEETGSLAYPEEGDDWSARISLAAEPEDDEDGEPGLPRRIRQASLAPQLRDSSGRIETGQDGDAADIRSPEEARATVSAIQQGWQRGRSLFDPADRSSGTDPEAADGETEQGDD